MPELPEVETTRQGISPFLTGKIVKAVTIRQFSLRWPINSDLAQILTGQTIHQITRRAKYLLLQCDNGTLIIHLGMSGKLRVLQKQEVCPPQKHDHVDIELEDGAVMRYNDPRRFGAILWTEQPLSDHPLLNDLGPEPLSDQFNNDYLWQQLQRRKSSIKTVIMNGKIVVGVGNIYANEALFLAGINPTTIANILDKTQCSALVNAIKLVLEKAIKAGGTTLKDFTKADGQPGYFAQELNVYGREGQPCLHCESDIQHYKEAQRATYYCPLCQRSTTA